MSLVRALAVCAKVRKRGPCNEYPRFLLEDGARRPRPTEICHANYSRTVVSVPRPPTPPHPTLKVYLFNLRYLLNPNDNVLSLLSAERERLVAIVNHGGAVCDKYHRLFVRRQNVL